MYIVSDATFVYVVPIRIYLISKHGERIEKGGGVYGAYPLQRKKCAKEMYKLLSGGRTNDWVGERMNKLAVRSVIDLSIKKVAGESTPEVRNHLLVLHIKNSRAKCKSQAICYYLFALFPF